MIFAYLGSLVALFVVSCNVETLLFFMVNFDISMVDITGCTENLRFGCLRILLSHKFEKFQTKNDATCKCTYLAGLLVVAYSIFLLLMLCLLVLAHMLF